MQSSTARSRKAAIGLLSAGAIVGGLVAGVVPASAAPQQGLTKIDREVSFEDGRYIVVLRKPSAAAATASKGGGETAVRSREGRAYADRLRSDHRTVARSVGAEVAHDYTAALNGFAARLTGKQAAALATDRRVLLVERDERRQVDTWASPEHLGLSGQNGVWSKTGGPGKAGSGVVVGILDTGIWPESKSFAGAALTSTPSGRWDVHRRGTKTYMDKADGTQFQGECMLGEGWEAEDCNRKLIGARYYPDIFETVPEPDRSPDEFMSPRDGDGHGTHTAGTAAGNRDVRATVEGRKFGTVSGMAPAARIAAYKVCFSDNDPDTGDCMTSASLAAIDDAVADGVDVINYSISGSQTTVIDSVELAFEGAAAAGIFVAASAGNSGPDASTVAHPSPWLTTVAANTHVSFENTVVLGNGRKLLGASINSEPLASKKLVNSADAALAGESAEDAQLCVPDTLDPAVVSGKIVVCTRGAIARVDKSAAVKTAGGVGMILINPSPNSLDADFHSVPSVHLQDDVAVRLLSYMDSVGANATARLVPGNLTKKVTPVPQIAGFSSRGPSLANDGDLLKPDISAPGVSVLAAVSPPTNSGRKFDLYSGTSMSSPHVAGLAAFMFGVNPNRTPMQLKSAMMTTARNLVDENGKAATDPFAQGAGEVRPKKFLDPGLFVTASSRQWLGFITGQGLDTGVAPIAAKDLNVPSMARSEVAGPVSFTRQFVSTRKGVWDVTVKVPGFEADTNRAKIVAQRARDIQDLRVTFTRTTAPLNEYATGFVILRGPTTVRMPVALKPVAVAAPAEVEGSGVAGSATVDITPGFTGTLPVEVSGLAKAETASDSVDTGDSHYFCVQLGSATKALRVDLDSVPNDADLDLFIYEMAGDCSSAAVAYLGTSATGSADETVTAENPAAGYYIIEVNGYAAAPGESTTPYVLDAFVIDDSATAGGLTVTPNPVPVVAGEDTSYEASWSGLDVDSRYLGLLEYDGASPTYISVDTVASP